MTPQFERWLTHQFGGKVVLFGENGSVPRWRMFDEDLNGNQLYPWTALTFPA